MEFALQKTLALSEFYGPQRTPNHTTLKSTTYGDARMIEAECLNDLSRWPREDSAVVHVHTDMESNFFGTHRRFRVCHFCLTNGNREQMLPESALLLIRESLDTKRSKQLLDPFEVLTDTLVFFKHMATRNSKILDDVVESSTVSVRVMSRPIRWLDLECQGEAHLSSRRTLLRKRRA